MTEQALTPPPPDAVKAVLVIAAYRSHHGTGPTFRELCLAIWPDEKLTYAERNERVKALYDHGVRWRCGQERSLNIKTGSVERALAIVRERRAA